jgi:transposase
MRPFRPFNLDQNYLLPPDVNDWLSPTHLARFTRTLVTETLDLTAIREAYRSKFGTGAPPYDPAMMTSVLIYCYCIGVRSSRKIEQATYDDLGLRFLTANQHPDHDSIAAFRKRHLAALGALFEQVLQLCAEVGLVNAGEIALYLDGTKMLAAASRQQTLSYARMRKTEEQLKAEVEQILREAEEADRAEDALYGPGNQGGGDVPEELADPQTARQRLRAAQEKLAKASKLRQEMDQSAQEQAEQQVAEASARREEHDRLRKPGRKPVVPDVNELSATIREDLRANLTDPGSRLMKDGATKAIVQAYNCQAVVAAGSQVIVACDVTQEENDLHQLAPMAQLAEQALHPLRVDLAPCDKESTGACDKLGADAGYLTIEGVGDARVQGFDLYIAGGKMTGQPPEPPAAQPAPTRGGFVMYVEPPKPATPFAKLQLQMQEKVSTPEGAAFYKKRSTTVEPVFGQIKENRGIRRMMMRGLTAAQAEWKLICTTNNILKVFRHDLDARKTPQDKPSKPPRNPCLWRSCASTPLKSAQLRLGIG